MNILIHPGFAKTATTYTQQVYSNLNDILYLGKDADHRFISDDLRVAHYKLFNCLNRKNNNIGLSEEQITLIENFSKLISKSIVESNKSNIVLSDELIFSNIQGNKNILLAINLLLANVEILVNRKFLKRILLLTVREQASLLQSAFPYEYSVWKEHAKDEQGLINFLKNNMSHDLFSTFWFYEVTKFAEENLENFELSILPFEYLENNKKIFNRGLFYGLDIELSKIDKVNIGIINGNSTTKNTQKINYYLVPTRFSELRSKLKITSRLHTLIKKTNLLNSLPDKMISYLRIQVNKFKPRRKYRSEQKPFVLSPQGKRSIQNVFASSNKKLDDKLKLKLKELGYHLE